MTENTCDEIWLSQTYIVFLGIRIWCIVFECYVNSGLNVIRTSNFIDDLSDIVSPKTPLYASTGPVLGRCCQHRPSTGPVLAWSIDLHIINSIESFICWQLKKTNKIELYLTNVLNVSWIARLFNHSLFDEYEWRAYLLIFG